ncbi:MAG: DNA-directed DNA polymerase [Methanobrevibacter sp.]|jgi:DNA polymerase I|nr:DNA-directed DNA polymerase [Candidatus Methanovirga basalitermitum]
MEKRKIILFDVDYVTYNEKPVVRLFGKEKEGVNKKTIMALDFDFQPYIYVVANDVEVAKKEISELNPVSIEIVTKKDFQVESQFLKVIFNHPQDVPKFRDEIRKFESVGDIREYDIPFYRRYLINNNIFPMSMIELNGEVISSFLGIENSNDLEIFKLSSYPQPLKTSNMDFKILSFDLEVRNPDGMPNSKKDEIIILGISTNTGINKVISTKTEGLDFVEKVDSEKEIIESFIKTVKENDIDIIVGYNSDNFDFPYLRDRAKIHDIDLDLSWEGSNLNFLNRGHSKAATFKGLIHIDLYLVMRRYISLDRYTLERVYFELFDEEKIDIPGYKIWEFWDNEGQELKNLLHYALDDVISTLKIAEMTLPLSLELTRIVGQPFFDITRMATGQQAEWYLVRKAYEYDEIIPNKPSGEQVSSREKNEKNIGGYVKEPKKGLHENLVQFDFRSLYPSIIISKNISPDVLLKKLSNGEYVKNIVSEQIRDRDPNLDNFNIVPSYNHKFGKKPLGFIPSVIGNILSERIRIKKQVKNSEDETEEKVLNVQQQALKRLANTMYGIYGFSRFRWYSFECAESITAWGRDYIQETIKKAEEYGFKTIYADTDGFYAKYIDT